MNRIIARQGHGAVHAAVLGLLCAAIPVGFALPKDANEVTAVPGRPAIVMPTETSRPSTAGATPRSERTVVVVSITGYTPPRSGRVEAVVRVRGTGEERPREVGRFAVFPNQAFQARGASEAQRFLFDLGRAGFEFDRTKASVRLEIDLVPVSGQGKDAKLTIGGAAIERR